jgi:GntR family transcriptional regulator
MGIKKVSRAQEIEQDLLTQLAELADSDGRLPGEEKLCELYGVSRTTIRSALGALAARGLIVRRQGMGNFVNQGARIANPLDQVVDFCEVIESNGHQASIQYLSAKILYPASEVAAALQRPNELAIERRTVFSADGAPVIFCINTIPLWVLPGSLAREVVDCPAISEPIFTFYEQRCNQQMEYRTGCIWPEVAQNLNLPELACAPLTPVQVIDEVGFNIDNQPILHSTEYYPGRYMSFELVRRRGFSRLSDRQKNNPN